MKLKPITNITYFCPFVEQKHEHLFGYNRIKIQVNKSPITPFFVFQ